MIDLKNEIEKLIESASEFYCKTANINSRMCLQGQVEAYQDCLDVINNYNIITAPKTIKLSEIVSKLNEIYNDSEFGSEIYFNRKLNAIGEGEYDKDWFMNTWTPFIKFKENKISEIINLESERTKWLYTLWIAGTIIEDDLKEVE